MEFARFSKDALRTESTPAKIGINPGLFFMSMVYAWETGALMDTVKRGAVYGKPLDKEKVKAGIVGCLQSLTAMAELLQIADEVDNEEVEVSETGNPANRYKISHDRLNTRFGHAIIGAFGEAGELAGAFVKSVESGGVIDRVNVAEEFGDIDWYKALAFDELGLTEDESRNAVIAKLKKRWGTEKADLSKSLVRDLDAERQILEANVSKAD